MFVELDTREGDGLTVTLEWDRATGQTQLVVLDPRSNGLLAFGVPAANAAVSVEYGAAGGGGGHEE
jgi:carotenoid cleavage dioxygenase-like enzyme